jgi:hypothetical protein
MPIGLTRINAPLAWLSERPGRLPAASAAMPDAVVPPISNGLEARHST